MVVDQDGNKGENCILDNFGDQACVTLCFCNCHKGFSFSFLSSFYEILGT